MPDVDSVLAQIAADRKREPLAPVTVIAPSHDAALQMRRRLARFGPYAGVRFEVLPRLAELVAGGRLTAAGLRPLARPIGDFLARQVAAQSQGPLSRVRELPGHARALRRIFQRLRRGGIRGPSDVPRSYGAKMHEVLRLYGLYREAMAGFYDQEDLLEAAAQEVASGRPAVLADLGAVYVAPPDALSAGAQAFLDALKKAARRYETMDDPAPSPRDSRVVLAPDPASEAREVVREVLAAMEAGVAIGDIAVFHGADRTYPRLLRDAFDAAGVPTVALPGVPLIESAVGRAVLGLARLADADYSRVGVIELLRSPALRESIPSSGGFQRVMATEWDRVSRDAGVTGGAERWEAALRAFQAGMSEEKQESDRKGEESRALRAEFLAREAAALHEVVRALITRLEPLRRPQAAAGFVVSFKAIVADYIDPAYDDATFQSVLREIDQLGTIDAVGGSFDLSAFAEALRADLEVAVRRPQKMGEGVVIADYRRAAGMRYSFVVLCGAYEGVLPPGPGVDGLVEDRVWEDLRRRAPFVEDAQLRMERAGAAVSRAQASASGGTLVWSAPLYEGRTGREYYPSPYLVRAASTLDPAVRTSRDLREHPRAAWLRRPPSPLAAMLQGPVVDQGELGLRYAVEGRQTGQPPRSQHLTRVAAMLRARRGAGFTEWDGNVGPLPPAAGPNVASPTSLEKYAECGFRYLCSAILRLNVVEEPEERHVMAPLARGHLVHRVLYRFFSDQKARGRPAPEEAWADGDRMVLLDILDDALQSAKSSGLTGLEIFAQHEARSLRADLERFLEEDTRFRQQNGAVPAELEYSMPPILVSGVTVRGVVDRIDRTPDGRRAWIIDYKTGTPKRYEKIGVANPLANGTRLQLPAYLSAAAAGAEAEAFYWFISRNQNYERRGFVWTPEVRQRFEETIAAIMRGIRSGAFPAVPGDDDGSEESANCKYCEFDRICSRRRKDEFAAKRDDPGLQPWLHVAEVARGQVSS